MGQKPKVVVSEETKTKLNEIGNKPDTYDDIIERLIDYYENN